LAFDRLAADARRLRGGIRPTLAQNRELCRNEAYVLALTVKAKSNNHGINDRDDRAEHEDHDPDRRTHRGDARSRRRTHVNSQERQDKSQTMALNPTASEQRCDQHDEGDDQAPPQHVCSESEPSEQNEQHQCKNQQPHNDLRWSLGLLARVMS
jgi:hypothetical protein